jgi:hypothetical protein
MNQSFLDEWVFYYLDDKLRLKLNEAGIFTVVELQQWIDSGNPHIKGFGAAARRNAKVSIKLGQDTLNEITQRFGEENAGGPKERYFDPVLKEIEQVLKPLVAKYGARSLTIVLDDLRHEAERAEASEPCTRTRSRVTPTDTPSSGSGEAGANTSTVTI